MGKDDTSSYIPPRVLLSGRELERMIEMKKAVIFLLRDYVERTNLKIAGYVDTADVCKDDPVIVSEAEAEISRLRRKVDEARGFIASLGPSE